MAQDDVAALLNNMAPDDRTNLLEELPAAVTKQMLSLLTEERIIAISLLGYPEDSIGRLMTPDYVSVRQNWTVEQVLAHIRSHGQDSETLSVIYVVNEEGLLIDCLRIRNILLASPDTRVSDLVDRRVVALKASDDQETAISIFRREDCTALPVTDSLGVLIGIVTVDDVLDVAESEATEDIHKIGGVEALDQPFLQIPLARLIRKRANWLVILFFGELLTDGDGLFREGD
jgi:magnesium transporter